MPVTHDGPSGKSVSLEEFIALNDEIVSLSRAGVPLELGLREVAADQPGRLGELSRVFSERMSRGQSLPEAIAAEGSRLPKVYRTVVEAGLRAGRLPAALEALTSFAWEVLDLRRKMGFALLYPLIVIALAYGLFIVFILEVSTRIRDTYTLIGMQVPGPLRLLGQAGATVGYWGWMLPALVAIFIAWWVISNRTQVLNPTGPGLPLTLIPGVRRIAANHRAANFAHLLALMLENEVPIHEALVLSAEATGDSAFESAAREIAAATSRGESLTALALKPSAIPPFLRWLMARREQGSLVEGLRLAADMYRRRANDQAAWLRLVFPVLTVIVVGGGATLFYTLTLFLPLIDMLKDMAVNSQG